MPNQPQTQSIIIYRSQAEADADRYFTENPLALVFVVVFSFAVMLVSVALWEIGGRIKKWWERRERERARRGW